MIGGPVLLDIDNTIFDYDRNEEHALKRIFSENGITYSSHIKKMYASVNKLLWERYESGLASLGHLRTERFRRLFEAMDISGRISDLEAFSDGFLRNISETIFFEPFAEKAVRYLLERYTVVFLTNGFHEIQKKRLISAGILSDPDLLVSSERAGKPKPDACIFEYAMKVSGMHDKSNAAMIGDNIGADIAGAKACGIRTIWYNKHGIISGLSHAVDHEISSMAEIMGIL